MNLTDAVAHSPKGEQMDDRRTDLRGSWPPKVDFDPPTITAATDWAQERIDVTKDHLQEVSVDIVADIKDIFGGASQCLSEIDRIRLAIQDRHLDYAERVLRETLGPVLDWIVGGPVPQRNPTPRLSVLLNPYDVFYRAAVPQYLEGKNLDEIQNQTRFQKLPMLLIHGMGQDGGFGTALSYWEGFIKEGHFYEVNKDYSEQLPFFLHWDSSIHNSELEKLIGVLATAGIPIAALMIIAHFRELERRAAAVGDFLTSCFFNYSDAHVFTVSHSLGSFVYASSEETRVVNEPGSQRVAWWNFQGAIPNNAFDSNGPFRRTGEFYSGQFPETRVFHSNSDAVLSLGYLPARLTPAMGQTGPIGDRDYPQIDVTLEAQETHGPYELIAGQGAGYFRKIRHTLNAQPRPYGW